MRRGAGWLRAAVALVAATGCHGLLDTDGIVFGAPAAQPSGGATSASDGGGGAVGGGDSEGGAGRGASGGGGGAGGAVETSCLDGKDNDGDALVDCADPDCGAVRCAPAVPRGWSGPALFYRGPTSAMAPSCPAGTSVVSEANAGLVAPPAVCTPCDCSVPSGGTCGAATATSYDSQVCDGGVEAQLSGAGCKSFSVGDKTNSALGAVIPVTSPGACEVVGTATATLPEPSWSERTLLCALGALGGGCAAGEVCVAAPAAPFEALVCIHRAGEEPCPSGPYATPFVTFSGWQEGRSCTPCGCGTPAGATCGGTTKIYVGTGCTTLATEVPHDGATCKPWSTSTPFNSYAFVGDKAPNGGACPKTGAEPAGAVAPTGATTVCCASIGDP
jgi:hypothetical protein